MQNSSTEDARNVIPRWRSLATTANWALSSARSLNAVILTSGQYADDLQRWREERTLESAYDIYMTGVITGERSLVWEGGLQLISANDRVDQNVIDAVKREFAPDPDPMDVRKVSSRLESREEYLRFTIRMLRKRLNDQPRNFMAALEIARLFVVLGTYNKAEYWLSIANHLAPGNRQVLRAVVQFYDIMGEVETALPYLWKSEALGYDPLVQSAEIAAADLSGRQSKVASRAKKGLRGLKAVDRRRSELALAVATIENHSGLTERKVFQFVAAGIADPTENALAQAVWLGEHSHRAIQKRFPSLELPDDAYEARAYLHFDARRYMMALHSAVLWYNDQPFQSHPLSFICTTAAIYCDNTAAEALPFADIVLSKHSADWNAVNAALLVYVKAGTQAKSKQALALLNTLAKTRTSEIFAKAGEGLYNYAFGNPDVGQTAYIEAMNKARSAKRNDLVFTAAAFYVVAEAQSGRVSPVEIGKAIETLDKLLPRLGQIENNDATRMWDRAKQLIVDDVKALSDISGRNDSFLKISLLDIPRLMDEAKSL